MKNSELQDPLNWQVAVNKILVVKSPERMQRLGIMTSEEMDEAYNAHRDGVSAQDFADTLVERDRQAKIEATAQWIESAPKNQKRVSA